MVCDICGKEGARIRRVSRSYGKGENSLVIEVVSYTERNGNIRIISCCKATRSERRRYEEGIN